MKGGEKEGRKGGGYVNTARAQESLTHSRRRKEGKSDRGGGGEGEGEWGGREEGEGGGIARMVEGGERPSCKLSRNFVINAELGGGRKYQNREGDIT